MPADETSAGLTPQETPADPTPKTYSEEYVRELREENKARRLRLKELEDQVSAIEGGKAREAEEALRRNQEFEKLAKQFEAERDALRAELMTLRMQTLRAKVAAEVGLPPTLADRLQGETEEALKADAETLKKTLIPAAPTMGSGGTRTTPTPTGNVQAETDAQRYARLFGGGRNIFGS